jgi:hypothetical protein
MGFGYRKIGAPAIRFSVSHAMVPRNMADRKTLDQSYRWLVIGLMLSPLYARAVEVFVNGVNVDGLTSQVFEKANVKLDEKGNVYIDAPGYQIKRVTPAAEKKERAKEPAASDGVISKRYYLVTEQNPIGASEFDIDLSINGKVLRTLKSSDEQTVVELTRSLKPGKNTVVLAARKVLGNKAQPKSNSKAHIFRVTIGEASVTKAQVTIEQPLIVFTRNASEANDTTEEFTLNTR